MSAYTLYDFSETINHINSPVTAADVETVEAAWGNGQGTEWSGGFLCSLKDGRWLYISGWNDYTGWGCQDGIDATFHAARPDRTLLTDTWDDPVPADEWDDDPADLNKWLREGADPEKAW